MKLIRVLPLVPVALAITSCTVGPNYKRPVVDVPATYRGQTTEEANEKAVSFGDEKWWEVFKDPQLQQLIRTALKQNYNVQIAASRVLQAQSQLTITRADQFPSINGNAQVAGLRQPGIPNVFPSYTYWADELTASASWNIDFWGRYRRATEAAGRTCVPRSGARRPFSARLLKMLLLHILNCANTTWNSRSPKAPFRLGNNRCS